MTRVIRICGNIAAGKTSLAKLLHRRFGWNVVLESIEGLPFFDEFYQDMNRWGFHQQVSFLASDLKMQQDKIEPLLLQNRPLVQDWLFEMHYSVYFQAFVEMGLVNHKEKVVFEELNRRIGRYIQKPDLVIFIDIPPSRSFERVRIRHRDAEMSIDVNYLRMIDRLLKDLIANYSTCPVQRIDGTQYDYVENDMDKNTITEAVHSFVQQVS